ncbi:MAG: hypothetical protein JNG89_09555 [Planctomycetaceae bacterium]|nr:hypothetical protein [Planctomycetaceae bacterium]
MDPLGRTICRARFRALRRRTLPASIAALAVVLWSSSSAEAATARSANFEVTADSDEVARLLATCAEELRQSLAVEWLKSDLPAWETRCIVRVDAGCDRLSGDTTYSVSSGRSFGWEMELRGPPERIVETLLPHEVLHTVLATHFRCAVPRWADEGAALSVEPEVEQARLWAMEGPQLLCGPRQPLSDLFACDEYPTGMENLRAFYVHGASITQFLLLAGKAEFVEFISLGMQSGWDHAVRTHYGFTSLAQLESAWLDWLQQERPVVSVTQGELLAEAIRSPSDTSILTAELGREPIRLSDSGAQ